jgi:GNAT superfamily N-acetyltransferase
LPTEKTTVRTARTADIEPLVGLLGQLFSIETDFHFDPARHARGLRLLLQAARQGRARVLVAEVDGEVVGMATVQTVVSTAEGARSGWIEDVVIHEDHRGKGLGSALTAAIERWAADSGIARLQLLADRRNRLALLFYDRHCFRQTNMLGLRKPVGQGGRRSVDK